MLQQVACFCSNLCGNLTLLLQKIMPKIVQPLSNSKIQSTKPTDKLYKMSDGGGLALWVYPTGNKSWKLTYTRHDGKRDNVTLGSYPVFSLADARLWAQKQRERLAKGESLKTGDVRELYHFESVVDRWIEVWGQEVTAATLKQKRSIIDRVLMPTFKGRDIRNIEPVHIVQTLKEIEKAGLRVNKAKDAANQVFGFAVETGLLTTNPVASVGKRAFKRNQTQHFKALTPDQLPMLIEFLETQSMSRLMKLALYFGLLSWTRPSEYAGARYDEIDENSLTWSIEKSRTKRRNYNGENHVVYMSAAMKQVYDEIKAITGNYEYLFYKADNASKHINAGSMSQTFRLNNFPTTAHGLRALVRTSARESGMFQFDTMEMALSHSTGDSTVKAYDRAKLEKERRELSEWWGDVVMTTRSKITGQSF